MTTATPKSQSINGALYKTLCEKLPALCDSEGRLSVADLATHLKMSSEGVYRWLRSDEISKRGRNRLVEVAITVQGEGALTEDDLRPFL